jgi:hypothetical protein
MTTPQIFQLNPHTEPTNVPPSKPSNLPSPLGDSFDSPRQHRNYLTPTTIYFTQPHIFSSFLHSLYFLFHFLSTRRLIWLFISLSSSSFVRLFIFVLSKIFRVPWTKSHGSRCDGSFGKRLVCCACCRPDGRVGDLLTGQFHFTVVNVITRLCTG